MHLRRCCVTIQNFVLRVVSYMNVFHEFFFVKLKFIQFVICILKVSQYECFSRGFCKVKSCSVIHKFFVNSKVSHFFLIYKNVFTSLFCKSQKLFSTNVFHEFFVKSKVAQYECIYDFHIFTSLK